MTSLSQFVSYQNGVRQAQGWSSNLYAEGVQTSATVNSVVGWQSAKLPTSNTPWLGGNNVVLLDGARANYGVQIDGTGQLMIKDIGAGDANNGQSITVTGASYAIFNGGATASPGVYNQIMMIQKGDDATLARMYESSFGRMPDPVGYESWKAQLDSGQMSLQKIGQSFVQSSEFQSLFGANSNDQQFVDALYTNVLGRAADKAGEAGYTAYLGSIEPTMGVTAARASLLVAFAASSEEIRHSSSWLVDPTKGGYADSVVLIPAQTLLDQPGGTINLGLTSAPSAPVFSSNATTNAWGAITTGSEILPRDDFRSVPATFLTYENNKIIFLSNNIPSAGIYGDNDFVYGSGSNGGTILSSSVKNNIFIGSGSTTITMSSSINKYDQALTINGFKAGVDIYHDTITDRNASSSGTIYNAATIISVTDGHPIIGSKLAFNSNLLNGGSHPNYVLELGDVGGGTAAEVAAAANVAYNMAGSATEHFIIAGQVTINSIIASAGDTIIYSYGMIGTGYDYQTPHADAFTAANIMLEAKLVGVSTTSLTHADFGGGQ